tara:strand:+ start:39762 stop:39971 length:210 start_codon:yes stop_codon:yes gene_type:complete
MITVDEHLGGLGTPLPIAAGKHVLDPKISSKHTFVLSSGSVDVAQAKPKAFDTLNNININTTTNFFIIL